jgi:hypothetical protein
VAAAHGAHLIDFERSKLCRHSLRRRAVRKTLISLNHLAECRLGLFGVWRETQHVTEERQIFHVLSHFCA